MRPAGHPRGTSPSPTTAPPTPQTPSGWPKPQVRLEANVAHGWCVSAGYPGRWIPAGRPVVDQSADASVLWAEQKVPLDNPSPLSALCRRAAAASLGPDDGTLPKDLGWL